MFRSLIIDWFLYSFNFSNFYSGVNIEDCEFVVISGDGETSLVVT
jgi:hypothetical protein